MRAYLPLRDAQGLHGAEYGLGAERLAEQLVEEARRTGGEVRRRVINQMHVLHELHVHFPGVQVVEAVRDVPAGGDNPPDVRDA